MCKKIGGSLNGSLSVYLLQFSGPIPGAAWEALSRSFLGLNRSPEMRAESFRIILVAETMQAPGPMPGFGPNGSDLARHVLDAAIR